jgi:hypothetical protein
MAIHPLASCFPIRDAYDTFHAARVEAPPSVELVTALQAAGVDEKYRQSAFRIPEMPQALQP